MRITLEIPGALWRRAQSAAEARGIPFGELVCQALAGTLTAGRREEKSWMRSFGGLRPHGKETARINRVIEEAFERIEAEDRK